MAQGITIKIEGLEKVKARFKMMQDRLKQPKTGMETIAIFAWKDVIDHFRQEMGPGNQKWLPTQKIMSTGKGKILHDTGRLRLSNRWRVRNNEAMVYNNTNYADYHEQQNDTYSLPARRFMWLSRKVNNKIQKFLAKFYTGQV